jgi:hypothetical protein
MYQVVLILQISEICSNLYSRWSRFMIVSVLKDCAMFVTGFTLSVFCGLLPGLSGVNCELLLRNFQYVISGNYLAVLCARAGVCVCVCVCVCSIGVNKLCSLGYVYSQIFQ